MLLDSVDARWRFYRQAADETAQPDSPSLAIQTAKELTKLNQIIHETMNIYCGSRGKVTASSIMYLYKRYADWIAALPSEMQIESLDVVVVPHLYYLQ